MVPSVLERKHEVLLADLRILPHVQQHGAAVRVLRGPLGDFLLVALQGIPAPVASRFRLLEGHLNAARDTQRCAPLERAVIERATPLTLYRLYLRFQVPVDLED